MTGTDSLSKNCLAAVIFLVAVFISPTFEFPSGAPLSACSHLMPVHIDGEMMETASPYLLLLNDTEYNNKPLKLTVTTIGPNARNFMAFMLQARSEFGQPVGRFSQVDIPVASKTMTCYDTDDTLTHTAAFIRPDMEVIWHPPSKNVGKIFITGSLAVTKEKFWAVRSELLNGNGKLDLSESKFPRPPNPEDNAAARTGHTTLIYYFVFMVICIQKYL